MTLSGLVALSPLIVVAAGSVVVLLAIAFRRSHLLTMGITLITFLLAFFAVFYAASQGTQQVTPLLVFDGFAYFMIGLLAAAALVITLLAYGYLRVQMEKPEEFYLLLLLATLGCFVLAASSHFASFFLGLEILSVSLYALVGYHYQHPLRIEAAVKYLILAASSAAFLLFGMALVYAAVGSMAFGEIVAALESAAAGALILPAGFALMMIGIGFKLALVPFHMWTPDVYEGAPVPAAAFVATLSKGSMFALLLRLYLPVNASSPILVAVFVVIAVATMLVGTLLALRQTNLKRLLAYSSIANLGYLLVAFLSGGTNGISAAIFYLVAYFISILVAFGVMTVLSGRSEDAGSLEDYRGLLWRRPWLAAILAAAMFSLAGIPLTAGFIGKFSMALAGVGAARWLLVIVLVISSGIGLYYYLRVVAVIFSPSNQPAGRSRFADGYTLAGGLALAVLALLLFGLGIFPAPFIQWIETAAAAMR